MKLRTASVSKQFQPLFHEKLAGVRHAEDGRLYAILSDPDPDKEESGAMYPEPPQSEGSPQSERRERV